MIEYSKLPGVILVTGGSGFIGTHLVKRLLEKTNSKIYNLDKLGYASNNFYLEDYQNHNNDLNSKYNLLNKDLIQKSDISKTIEHIKPDLIMHLAAESHVDRSINNPSVFFDSNIKGTFNLLEAVRLYFDELNIDKKNSFKFHHISTDEVFGSLGEGDFFNEKTAYDPRSPYSASKAASDHLVNAWNNTYKIPTLITNCSNNYGPYQFPEKLIPLTIINCLLKKDIPLYGNGLNIRDWLYVEDHIDALLMVAINGKIGEKYCIGGGKEVTNEFIVQKICKILDIKKPASQSYEKYIKFVKDRPGHDYRYAIDSSKIKSELGWYPKFSFDKGIRKTIDWYLDNQNWWEKKINK